MPEPFLIIDVEATCWESRLDHQVENEIIEIGAAIVDAQNEIVWNAGWFVRPILNPILSDFCMKLTSITQTDVNRAPLLPAIIEELAATQLRISGRQLSEIPFVSWGNYDRNQFKRDCERHRIRYPFGPHVNLKTHFAAKHGGRRRGVKEALVVLGLEFEGTHHRGKDDAHNIARIFTLDFGTRYAFERSDS